MAYALDRPPTNSSSYPTLSSTSLPSIRGSLDPSLKAKKSDRQGWRYLQCTNVKDELRVLLPPRPAAIYANLLKVEAHLLAKSDAEALQEAQLIAVLKNAMVERCEKLAQKAQLSSPQAMSRIVEAPVDFKLKRLERWWEQMEASGRTKQSSSHLKTQDPARHNTYPPSTKIKSRSKEGYTPPSSANSYTKRASPISLNTQATLRAPYPGEAPSSASLTQPPIAPRKNGRRSSRPAPLSVAHTRHSSDQISPTVAHMSRAADQVVYQNSQDHSLHTSQVTHGRPSLRHSVVYTSSYTENHASPLEAQFSPYVTTNGSTLSSHHMSSSTEMAGAPNAHPAYSTRTPNPSAVKSPAVDPSYLKDRFHQQYMTGSSDSNSSSSLDANKKAPPVAQPFPYAASDPARRASQDHLLAPTMQPSVSRDTRTHRASFSSPVPGMSISTSHQEHRRRATVDGNDTDRYIQRFRDMNQGTSYTRHAAADQVASRRHRIYQSPTANDSPQSSGSQGSPYSYSGSQVRSSPPVGLQPQRISPQHLSNGSPSLLPPAPALSNSRRGSYESEVSASGKPRSPRKPDATGQSRQVLRKTNSRRGLREEAALAQGNSQAVRSPSHFDDLRRAAQQDDYTRGRTRRGERSPRQRYSYDSSPRRDDAVIPDMSILSPISSNRNSQYSRYTSGESSVSEPVIPDVSLIMEAEAARSKGDRIRRRLVPTRSSSESGGEGLATDFQSDNLSAVDDTEYVHVGLAETANGNGAYYRRPYRTRDGYGSGYNSEAEGGQRSRAPSRAPSRPPSRGILKRSSSVCSARSTKSVRIEIPRDRRALEEVRDAEDKVESAKKHLEDLHRQRDKGANVDSELRKANKSLDDAHNSVRDKEENYHAILAIMKEKRLEAEAPKYV